MENNRQPSGSRGELGPAPAAARHGRVMSPSRAALLETLRAQARPTTLAALAHSAGLHENTVREHLDALLGDGLAVRSPAEPSGRGRPAWLYEATDADPQERSENAGLVAALAHAIHHGSPAPVDDAVAAGREWGQYLARQRGAAPQQTPASSRREVVRLFEDLGFAPETDARATSVRLTRCPLLEAAHRYPDVVCGVHRGLTQAALEEYGADSDGVVLLPFAEPGACRLHLTASQP